MRRKIVITASAGNISLNAIPDNYPDVLVALGFTESKAYSGLYVALDASKNDIICYDNDSTSFVRVIGGALDDNGSTFMSYVNAKDGWETFMEDYRDVEFKYFTSLEDAINW